MKTQRVLFLSLLFLFGCFSQSDKQTNHNSREINIFQLKGIWAENKNENASFEIKNDSMYFVEDYKNPVHIQVVHDTLITYYDGLITRDKILKVNSDSLILLNEVGKSIRLYKRE